MLSQSTKYNLLPTDEEADPALLYFSKDELTKIKAKFQQHKPEVMLKAIDKCIDNLEGKRFSPLTMASSIPLVLVSMAFVIAIGMVMVRRKEQDLLAIEDLQNSRMETWETDLISPNSTQTCGSYTNKTLENFSHSLVNGCHRPRTKEAMGAELVAGKIMWILPLFCNQLLKDLCADNYKLYGHPNDKDWWVMFTVAVPLFLLAFQIGLLAYFCCRNFNTNRHTLFEMTPKNLSATHLNELKKLYKLFDLTLDGKEQFDVALAKLKVIRSVANNFYQKQSEQRAAYLSLKGNTDMYTFEFFQNDQEKNISPQILKLAGLLPTEHIRPPKKR